MIMQVIYTLFQYLFDGYCASSRVYILQDVDFITECVALCVSNSSHMCTYKCYRTWLYSQSYLDKPCSFDSQFAFIINWFLFLTSSHFTLYSLYVIVVIETRKLFQIQDTEWFNPTKIQYANSSIRK